MTFPFVRFSLDIQHNIDFYQSVSGGDGTSTTFTPNESTVPTPTDHIKSPMSAIITTSNPILPTADDDTGETTRTAGVTLE